MQLWNTFHPPELVRPTLETTLKTLQLDYVDLYIVEMPTAFKVNVYFKSYLYCLLRWIDCIPKFFYLHFLKPGDVFYPKDENGKHIYHETDLRATWEVSIVDLHSTLHFRV